MRKHVLVLMTSVVILACDAIAASAQAPSTPTPNAQQSPTVRPTPGESDGNPRGGMMGGRMMGGGMMDQGYRLRGRMGGGMMHPLMLRMIFSLIDADGDGTISLQEWQAAQERIFKAMDANKDGTVTLEEMQAFIRGTPVSQQ